MVRSFVEGGFILSIYRFVSLGIIFSYFEKLIYNQDDIVCKVYATKKFSPNSLQREAIEGDFVTINEIERELKNG